jgi:NADH-quinone oxidoreductase subunit F
MNGRLKLKRIGTNGLQPHVHPGPLLTDFLSGAGGSLEEYLRSGGYEVARRVASQTTSDEAIQSLEEAGLRGRAGGGYPTAHKWWLVARQEAEEKYFICNANAGQPGGFKERFLLSANPHRVIEAVITGALAVGAGHALIAIPRQLTEQVRALEEALGEARRHGFVGDDIFNSGTRLELSIYRTTGEYIIGEETALLELIEGKVGQPRVKPPLPTAKGLFGAPTVVNNLETVLQAHYILKVGAESYRRVGPPNAPGTLIFNLSGHVKRPGLYELPLGTTARELVFEYGQGTLDGSAVKAVFPGGVSSPVLGPEGLDLSLDFDSLKDAESDLGSGAVIVVAEGTCMVQLATQLAAFFHEASCGKCQPCKDGTHRTEVMLSHIERLEEKSIDRIDKVLPASPRTRVLNVINSAPAGISYTDTAKGLDKIRHLCEFYKYRGDCHHSTEAANAIQSLMSHFADEFEQHSANLECQHERLLNV